MIIVLNKPFRVLCQFTDSKDRSTLADYVPVPDVYPAGRLDFDTEGLVVLTDDGALQSRISSPRFGMEKSYWAQVEGIPDEAALEGLRKGVLVAGRLTRPAQVARIGPPEDLWLRTPPVRYRKSVPDSWLSITLKEGRNRQVRRMTAAVGFPVLRLIRYRIGPWTVSGLAPGEWREVSTPADRTTV
ncbi:MAG: pseudouridine synthase [Gammaproteobacteria bacterium]|jgi:23S rRNA pseudouridine2457 synthase